MDCWSESCSSWLTSTKSCGKQKWHKKVLGKQFLYLDQSSKYLNSHEKHGLLISHNCTVAVAGQVVSTAETPDILWPRELGCGSAAWAMKLSKWLYERMSHSLARDRCPLQPRLQLQWHEYLGKPTLCWLFFSA